MKQRRIETLGLEVPAGGRRWVFEIKFAGTEAEVPKLLAEGASQMRDRRYGETPVGQSVETLLRAVLVFSSEKRKFDAWKLVEREDAAHS